MDVQARRQNERKFGAWSDSADGGRTYVLTIPGRRGWTAKYVKVVDRDEKTLRFAQEIYDATGTLVEVHEKFPVDLGHRKVR